MKEALRFMVADKPLGLRNKTRVYSQAQRTMLYRMMFSRRDVRRFRRASVPRHALHRVLEAAHHAGSVGFMQPWNFIVVTDLLVKQRVHTMFLNENRRAAMQYRGKRRRLYDSLKLEGILEAPINICVTCDRQRGGSHVLGRRTIRNTDVFSTCCAIQNLWLAARAEGLGVGWVSIVENRRLRRILGIPPRILPVAYLCLGYPKRFCAEPELQTVGWRRRLPLSQVICWNRWAKFPRDGVRSTRDLVQGGRGKGLFVTE